MYKQFDLELFKNNDAKGRKLIKNYLAKKLIIDNPDTYGPDLIVGNCSKFYAEVQINHRWPGGDFPYSTVTIPQRKKKYKNAGKVYYFIISADSTRAVIIDDIHLDDKYLKEHYNKYMKSGEFFYLIPLRLCRQVEL